MSGWPTNSSVGETAVIVGDFITLVMASRVTAGIAAGEHVVVEGGLLLDGMRSEAGGGE